MPSAFASTILLLLRLLGKRHENAWVGGLSHRAAQQAESCAHPTHTAASGTGLFVSSNTVSRSPAGPLC